MTLLTPVPAAIAAAITIPVLVVLYLLKLRRRPVRVSSTLLWEQSVRDLQANVPLRLLRPSLLLLLHLAILGLFLLAMARPVLDASGTPPAKVVLLVDRSASMGAVTGGQSRLSVAVERALEAADNALRGDAEVCVVAFAAEPRALTGFTRDRAAVREALSGLGVADQPADLPAALRLGSALCAEGSGEEAVRRPGGVVVLVSDGGLAAAGPLTVAGAGFRFVRVGPADAAAIDNLGIVAIAARRDYEDPGLVRVFVRIANAGSVPVTVPVALTVAGDGVDQRVVEVPARTPESAGEAAVTLTARYTGAAIATVSIGRGDELAADDAAALVLESIVKPRIVLVAPDVAPGGPPLGEGPEWLLADALRELRPRSFRLVERSVFEASEPDADLVVFDRAEPSRLPPVPSMSFGAGLSALGLGHEPGESAGGTYVLSWERSHPVLRQVSMDVVYVSRSQRIAIREDPRIRWTELARGTAGPLLLLGERDGVRRLVAAFDLAHSNWPLTVGFPIFLTQAVDYLTMRGGEEGGTGTFTTTQGVEVAVPAGSVRVQVSGPAEFQIEIPAGQTRASLGVLERAGVYTARPLPDGEATPIAVNLLDETETMLGLQDQLRVSGQVVDATSADAGPREVWPWLVIAALVLLSVEWCLYAWQMRV